MHRISQDGTRVRACAGAASLRGEKRLEELLKQAQAHVTELAALLDDPEKSDFGELSRTAGLSAKKKAAQTRAAKERVERIEAADFGELGSTELAEVSRVVAQLPALKSKQSEAAKKAGDGEYGKKLKKGQPRVSTTDADARVMKMGDGGFRPAVNVQLATDTESRAIVGVQVTNVGSDKGLAEPMREQVEHRTAQKVGEHLMDGLR